MIVIALIPGKLRSVSLLYIPIDFSLNFQVIQLTWRQRKRWVYHIVINLILKKDKKKNNIDLIYFMVSPEEQKRKRKRETAVRIRILGREFVVVQYSISLYYYEVETPTQCFWAFRPDCVIAKRERYIGLCVILRSTRAGEQGWEGGITSSHTIPPSRFIHYYSSGWRHSESWWAEDSFLFSQFIEPIRRMLFDFLEGDM